MLRMVLISPSSIPEDFMLLAQNPANRYLCGFTEKEGNFNVTDDIPEGFCQRVLSAAYGEVLTIQQINKILGHNIDEDFMPNRTALRQSAYESMVERLDGMPLINWGGNNLSIDQANAEWLRYFAENSAKADELQQKIIDAKRYIRTVYPD